MLHIEEAIRLGARKILVDRVAGDTDARFREVERLQWMKPADVPAYQRQRLTELLTYAAAHVPYYRDLLDQHAVVRNGTVDVDRFTDLPLLSRTTLIERHEDLKSDELDRLDWRLDRTGGSTGEPVRFLVDLSHREWVAALKRLREGWAGFKPGGRKMMFWGSERDLFAGGDHWRTRLTRWSQNETWVNAFRMGEEDIRNHVRSINTFKPDLVLAYAPEMYEIARYVEAHNLPVYGPDTIMTGTGALTDEMRACLSRVFRSDIYNRYGSREFGSIASDCSRHEGLHLSVPHVYVEVLDANGRPAATGELGEVVVTSLNSRAMPLIRYRIGDVAAMSIDPCSCGRGWPMLDRVEGRTTDIFVRADGGVVTPIYLRMAIGVYAAQDRIRRYQVVQEAMNHVRILVVPAPGTDAAARADLAADMQHRLKVVMGEACRVDVEFVDDIAPSASGKFRYVVSNMKTD